MYRFLCVALLGILLPLSVRAQAVKEVVTFLNSDGEDALVYEGLRSNWGSYDLFYDKGATLDAYLYFFPNEYRWDRTDERNDIIKISQGDYSFIQEHDLVPHLTELESGDYLYRTATDLDESDPQYGYWNRPNSFSKFVYAWVVPENIEIVDMKSNRDGEWVRRGRAVAWFGQDVNNVSFEMTYRFSVNEAFDAVDEAVGTLDGVTIDRGAEGVRLTLADTLLFASGSADLTEQGLGVIDDLASALDFESGLSVIVEGHTDNVPIRGALMEVFATNWELSAVRALAVVKRLQAQGAPPTQLEAHAFGEHQPVATNETAEGRAANRRISILLSND